VGKQLAFISKQKITKEELSMANLKLKSVRVLQIREAFQRIYTAENTEEFEGLLNHKLHK
jgi:hypothetical protein